MAAFPHRTTEDEAQAETWWERVKHHEGGSVAAKSWYATAIAYEREIFTLRTLLKMDPRQDADEAAQESAQ